MPKIKCLFQVIIMGEKINTPLYNSDFNYFCSYPTGKISQIIHKDGEYQPLFWRDYNFPPYISKYEQYTIIKDFIKTNDLDVIDLKEEILDPELYNNSRLVYPKALWVTYKLKTEQLDGELKVRLLIY